MPSYFDVRLLVLPVENHLGNAFVCCNRADFSGGSVYIGAAEKNFHALADSRNSCTIFIFQHRSQLRAGGPRVFFGFVCSDK